jgi:hypothetical protein
MKLIELPKDIINYIISFTSYGTEILLQNIVEYTPRPCAKEIPFVVVLNLFGDAFLYLRTIKQYNSQQDLASYAITCLYLPSSKIKVHLTHFSGMLSEHLKPKDCLGYRLYADTWDFLAKYYHYGRLSKLISNPRNVWDKTSTRLVVQPVSSTLAILILILAKNDVEGKYQQLRMLRRYLHCDPDENPNIDEMFLLQQLGEKFDYLHSFDPTKIFWLNLLHKIAMNGCRIPFLDKLLSFLKFDWNKTGILSFVKTAIKNKHIHLVTHLLYKRQHSLRCNKKTLRFAAKHDLVALIEYFYSTEYSISYRRLLTAFYLGGARVKEFIDTIC